MSHRRTLFALFLALSLPAFGQDDRKAEIERCLEWLGDPDPEISAMAARKLAEAGKDAVPALERLLKAKGALEIYEILKDIQAPRPVVDPGWVGPADLPTDEELRRDLPEIGRSEAERYVHARFIEACAHYRRFNYQRAFDMVNALILLEPGSRRIEDMRKLRRACDTMVIQTAIVRSRVLAGASCATVGEQVELTLRMENVSPGPLRIGFGSGNGLQVRGYAITDIRVEALDPLSGTVTMTNRSGEIPFENPIDIAMGAQWERVFTLDTALDFAEDEETLRRYTVSAWTQPTSVETPRGGQARRLVFEPAVIQVVPKKYASLAADPVAGLVRAIEAGDSREVFVAAMLAPAGRQGEVVELLIGALEKAPLLQARATIARMLTFLTDQRLGDDPRTWKDWWERQRSSKAKARK